MTIHNKIRWTLAGPFLPLAVLVVLCAAVGCGGRTFTGIMNNRPGSDGGAGTDGTVRPDGWVRPDGSTPCQDQDRWELNAVPIDTIVVLSPALGGQGLPRGVSLRVMATVAVNLCDELAGVQSEVDTVQTRIRLRAYVWRYMGTYTCPPGIEYFDEFLAYRDLLAGSPWTIIDAYEGLEDPARATAVVRECMLGEDCGCALWEGIPGRTGESCMYDCMCEWPLSCVWEGQTPPEGGWCYQTCSVDSDCPPPHMCVLNYEDIPEGVCDFSREQCSSNGGCPAGFTCQYWSDPDSSGRFCLPAMDVSEVGEVCGDDCDCGDGLSCVQMDDTMQQSCQIKCRGDWDCPGEMCCDSAGYGWQDNMLRCDFCYFLGEGG